MTRIKILLPLLLCMAIFSCKKEKDEVNHLSLLDCISKTKYFTSDPFKNKYPEIYGEWKVIGTSGGFHGGGYPPDFDYLIVKPNAIFGIVRNDSLLTTGKVVDQNDPKYDLLIHLISDDSNSIPIQIIQDYEKFVRFQSDTMYLYSTCCDRYDTIFKRIR